MVEHVKGLRRPFYIVIHGRSIEVVQIGYVAHSLSRTPWTIKAWVRLGLFPRPPFVIDPNGHCTKRALYPVRFVEALALIADQGYLGGRLDREDWQRFQRDAFDAYDEIVSPLVRGVTDGPVPKPGSGCEVAGV